MAGRQTVIHSMHDLGLAAWFGGSLFGAVGLNGAAAAVRDAADRPRVASIGWAKWAPVNGAAIVVHGIGALSLLTKNSGRVVAQSGAGSNTALKSVLTVAAVGATVWSGLNGAKLAKHSPTPAAGATDPTPATDPEAAQAQKQLKLLQWSIPVLTGALLLLSVEQAEQQKPSQLVKGLLPGGRA
ncbi:hypothetical protein ACFFKU_10735 [Kineococcus gynurae]|uniref:Uncharacterized protein n=1 Tax=Kineococcus gynurae TaxID=452979 RepID=A0ABV5LUV7_9ACTN